MKTMIVFSAPPETITMASVVKKPARQALEYIVTGSSAASLW